MTSKDTGVATAIDTGVAIAPATSTTGVAIELPDIEPTLDELFNRNPLGWSDADLHQVVLHMRRGREIFNKEDTAAKTAGRRVNVKKAVGEAKNLTLESLGL